MIHQNKKKKLNLRYPHRISMLRNQVISLIENGKLITTEPSAKEARRLAEKVVTIAKKGNDFNSRRKAKALLPYKEEALVKLFTEIAPKYVNRAGGYTRVVKLPQRIGDTAPMSYVEWV